jgi:hypothetical protein
MKKSVIARGKRAHSSVWRGTKVKTVGGLKKGDLKKNKAGKIVSRRASDASKKGKGYKAILKWSAAFKQARKNLKVKGFKPCKKGSVRYSVDTQCCFLFTMFHSSHLGNMTQWCEKWKQRSRTTT